VQDVVEGDGGVRAAAPFVAIPPHAALEYDASGLASVRANEVSMATVTFDVPEGALSALRLSPTEFVKKMRLAAALLWYSQGDISQSKAADIAGTSRAEFIDELAHRRIPVVQVTPQELRDEIHRE
jgi:predicted HTH domain antitoxin